MANEHIINNNLIISGSVTSSVGFAGDGSGLTNITSSAEWDGSRNGDSSITGSLVISGSSASVNLLNAGKGVSGSFSGSFEGDGSKLSGLNINGLQASGSILSGSFSGSYQGDGSGLTNVNPFPFSGTAIITGSLIVSSSLVDFSDATVISGSTFSGSFRGDGSGLTNLPSQEWDGSRNGDSSITGSFVVSGSSITVDLKGDTTLDENILISNTGDSTSLGIGSGSLQETTKTRNSIAIGIEAGNLLTSGSSNIYIGNEAGETAVQTVGDTAVGHQALQVTTGIDTGDGSNNSCNTAVGFQAFKANTQGEKGTAIGANALANNTTGLCNTAVGHEAGCNNTTGIKNVAIGDVSLLCTTTASHNVAVGNCSGYRLEGSDNTAIGKDALRGSGDITGGTNTALGSLAGSCLTGDSDGNVYLGYKAGPSTGTTESNQLYINNNSGTPLIKGNFSTSQVAFAGGVSGSFSGSFRGDGSGLTGLNTNATPELKYRVYITGSVSTAIKPVLGNNISNDLYSVVLGGANNRSTGDYSVLAGGLLNTASADYSFIGGGTRNNVSSSAVSSSILAGFDNTVDFANSHVIGSSLTADKANYTFLNNLDVQSTVSASIFSGSFVGDATGLTGITSLLPTGLVSSSLQFNSLSSPFTGSFTGSFTGNGSNLTNVTASLVNFNNITNTPALVSSSAQFIDITAPFTGSFTGSFVGDGSGLTGISADAAGSNTHIQFNNNGNLGASGSFTFTNSDTLTIGDHSTSGVDGQIHLKEEDGSTTAIIINSGSHLSLYKTNLSSALKHSGTQWSFEGTTASTSTSTGAVIVKGGVGIAGDLFIGGNLTAEQYIVSSSVTHVTQSFSSGSTIFGDTSDDTHQFIGISSFSGSTNFSRNGLASNTVVHFSGSARFEDNAILRFGTGSGGANNGDLSIYHSTVSGNSIIGDTGEGDLLIHGKNRIRLVKDVAESEVYADFNTDGAVELYYDNVKKFSTSADGVVVSGSLTANSGSFHGGLTSNGYVILSQVSQSLNFQNDTEAAAGGVPLGGLYRNGNFIAIRLI